MSINSNYEHIILDMLHVVKIWHKQRSLGKNVYYTFIPNCSNLEATKKFLEGELKNKLQYPNII